MRGYINNAKLFNIVRKGQLYYHYKDKSKLYLVTNLVINEETEEPMVVYRALYGECITWARNYSSWSLHMDATPKFTLVELPWYKKFIVILNAIYLK
jgi:hypothetical protein